jgi:hypothetical protein
MKRTFTFSVRGIRELASHDHPMSGRSRERKVYEILGLDEDHNTQKLLSLHVPRYIYQAVQAEKQKDQLARLSEAEQNKDFSQFTGGPVVRLTADFRKIADYPEEVRNDTEHKTWHVSRVQEYEIHPTKNFSPLEQNS